MFHIDLKAIDDPFLDRRQKLLPCQKEMLKWWYRNRKRQQVTVNDIARIFKISRYTIYDVLNTKGSIHKKKVKNKNQKARYVKEKHTKAMAKSRRWKTKRIKDILVGIYARPMVMAEEGFQMVLTPHHQNQNE